MKSKIALLLLVQLLAWLTALSAHAQGTAFTYQGRLTEPNGVVNGSYDFTFAVFETGSGGVSGTGTITNLAVAVSNGLFTTTLDFGNAPEGAPAWLEIGVRPSSSTPGAFTTLAPRQPILPTPYAMFATTASNLVGSVALAQLPASVVTNGAGGVNLSGAFTGNGAGVTNVNAATLGGLSAGTFWQLGGNNVGAGQFLGSTNNQPLELKVNDLRALRLEDNGDSARNPSGRPNGAPNLVGGSPRNFASPGVVGATIAGGGATNYIGGPFTNSVRGDFGVVGGGYNNTVGGAFSTIAGGVNNVTGSNITYSTIGGGFQNSASSRDSTIAGGLNNGIGANSPASVVSGGQQNTIEEDTGNSTISGGRQNSISGFNTYATIGGGFSNRTGFNTQSATIGGGSGNTIGAFADYSTIPGGLNNLATGEYAFAAGHRAKALNTGAFVWADSQDADFSSTAANQFLVRAAGGVGINTPNPVVTLTVEGSGAYNSAAAAAIAVRNTTAGKTWEWHVLDDGKMQFADLGAGATRMLIDTNGNVSANSFNPTSDRHAKENFAAVSAQEILAKVAALPITRWNFKGDTATPHVGPMAQDFHAAFGTGMDDRHIATVDADGVALAAIQGLHQKLEEQTAAARRKDAEITELKTRLEKLEQWMNLKAGAAR